MGNDRAMRISNLTMDGNWIEVQFDDENQHIIQARTDNDLQFTTSRTGSTYFTIKSGRELVVSSFNLADKRYWLRGSASVLAEILKQVVT